MIPQIRAIHWNPVSGRERLNRWGSWSLVAFGSAIPVSTAASNVLLVLVVLSGLLSGLYARNWRKLLNHPVSRAAFALFAWLACTLVYTEVSPGQALHSLGKYLDLLFIPLCLPFFADPRVRRAAVWAFVGANLVVVFISSGEAIWQLLTQGAIATEPEVFHKRITQGLLLAFTAYWILLHIDTARGTTRIFWAGLFLLIGIDLFLFTSGRTGQVLFLLLAGLALWQRFRTPAVVLTVLAGALILVLAYVDAQPFQNRLAESLRAPTAIGQADFSSSTALRLSFYPNSLALIAKRPWFGYGIGSFAQAYADQVRGTPYPSTDNPHNTFLLFWTEAGILSVILFLYLLYRQWRSGVDLDLSDRHLLYGLLLLVLADSLLNSFMKDSTEGHLYAYFSALLSAPLLGSIPSSDTRAGR